MGVKEVASFSKLFDASSLGLASACLCSVSVHEDMAFVISAMAIRKFAESVLRA